MISRSNRLQSILVLSLSGDQLEAVLLRRTNGTVRLEKQAKATLALNVLNDDPQLVGREIAQHLEKNGLRERRCAVCLPPHWALFLQTAVPDIPDADVESFLALEAERGFPYAPDALAAAALKFRSPGGQHYAIQVAVPRQNVIRLETALRAARLQPLTMSLGMVALQGTGPGARLVLSTADDHIDLLIESNEGIAALRSLRETIEREGARKTIDLPLLWRELKVTLGQLPADVAASIRQAALLGQGEIANLYAEELLEGLQEMGLTPKRIQFARDLPALKLEPADAPVTPAVAFGAGVLRGLQPPLEFLPPRVSAWQRASQRFASRKLAATSAVALLLFMLVGGAFLYQQWQLRNLQQQWSAMEKNVQELEFMQQQIKRFRPWFDESFPSMRLLRRVTEAFPEDGVVTAKALEIRERSAVNCSGIAEDHQAFLQMLDRLRDAREVKNLTVDQMRGKAPLQFSFNFQWGEQSGNEN